ncbi:MAG: hypothetical protein ABSG92_08765 [Conexivisphaerales archaeon]|jgi:ArsR family transcriptional regulator
MTEGADTHFDASRAELFESLGHPVRIRILRALEDGPLGFADLKRKVGIESSGHLEFHLGKLTNLVTVLQDGSYSLSDEGREALRVIGAEGSNPTSSSKDGGQQATISRAVLAGLVAAVILVAAFAGVLYWQSSSSLGVERRQVANLIQQMNNLTQQLQEESVVCGVNNQTGNFDFSPESAQVVSSSGLGMNLTVSSGSITCGGTVYANVSLFNTLDVNLTLPLFTSSLLTDWGHHSAYICGSDLPVQLAVFDGYYTASNFSEAGEPLQLAFPDFFPPCPTPVPSPSGLVFLPDSGIAYGVSSYPSLNGQLVTVSVSLENFACGVGACDDETGASGYYSASTVTNNGFLLFQFGAYTIAASDVWGDTALVHFVVQ